MCACSIKPPLRIYRLLTTSNGLVLLLNRSLVTSSVNVKQNQIIFATTKRNPQIIELGKRLAPEDDDGTNSNRRGAGRKGSIRWFVGSVALLMLPATAFALGCWQVKRLKWKLDLIEMLKTQMNTEAIPFPEHDTELLNDLEYRRVHVTGEFLHDREFAIHPRGRFDKGHKEAKSGLVANSAMSSHGAHIITPFKLAESGRVILINRGWVPTGKISPSTRSDSQIKGRVSFDAVVRRSEKRPQFVSNNIPERGIWYYKDFEAMARCYGTEPIYLEATYESTVPGGPIGGQTNVTVRNEHLNYLITWYSLCGLTLAMWFMKFWR